jgi:hypothetical protein
MGGYGSGRWGAHSKNCTVEDCLTLNLEKLVRERLLRGGLHSSGNLRGRQKPLENKSPHVAMISETHVDDGRAGYICPQGESISVAGSATASPIRAARRATFTIEHLRI